MKTLKYTALTGFLVGLTFFLIGFFYKFNHIPGAKLWVHIGAFAYILMLLSIVALFIYFVMNYLKLKKQLRA
ncbi:hypothetical protein FYC62_15195 [Pedobacter aquae]|uniref:Uncharacterized protein n=1 Tax=Pedobacter aquae TaxID=2605747 RepID=A0A5C0VMB3_9SPHI|nr:hypothetical protein [Pedobacter aquae]QEK52863.1 hypothetical protein FYC62_15195 [Pedobacter aquae]